MVMGMMVKMIGSWQGKKKQVKAAESKSANSQSKKAGTAG